MNDFFGKHGVPVLPVKAWFDFVLEPAARKRGRPKVEFALTV